MAENRIEPLNDSADWRSDLLDALDAIWTRDHPDEWPKRLESEDAE